MRSLNSLVGNRTLSGPITGSGEESTRQRKSCFVLVAENDFILWSDQTFALGTSQISELRAGQVIYSAPDAEKILRLILLYLNSAGILNKLIL